ncbi:hypothetical protein BBOV_II004720 [Babesia bovis T2Bo]|uniref:DNA recombination and repair protein Rad51-like C-terminal domain-containing protein n=1 Tax=Babesia bovis TaxID=5865 RepID=A7AU16_BABBO|nr:hypothetical protein BBOV_II004720 [Babesia bovis T2Bo]EDO06427.1 hypothetical protein BBOV_II004720 [Babesia bovis T2Bo]|eukprot:XP_001609995.1 hypothetical protein [Babesia bovis T2Bo]
MDSLEERCSFSATGSDIFRRYFKRYVFTKCPFLNNDAELGVFTGGGTICVSGPCSSGKTLVCMHALADIISDCGMCERVIYVDIDLSFDLALFKNIFRNQYCTLERSKEAQLNDALNRLYYIPVYNMRDLPPILMALDSYISVHFTQIMILDSLPLKQGSRWNPVFDSVIKGIRYLHNRYRLLLLYTKIENKGRTAAFTMKRPITPEMSMGMNRNAPNNQEEFNKVLHFAIPLYWLMPAPSIEEAIYAFHPTFAYNEPKEGTNSSGERTYYHRHNQQTVLEPTSHDVTLFLIPSRTKFFERYEYLGCIYNVSMAPNSLPPVSTECTKKATCIPVSKITDITSQDDEAPKWKLKQQLLQSSGPPDIGTDEMDIDTNLVVKEQNNEAMYPKAKQQTRTVMNTANPTINLEILQKLRFRRFRISKDAMLYF